MARVCGVGGGERGDSYQHSSTQHEDVSNDLLPSLRAIILPPELIEQHNMFTFFHYNIITT